LLRRRPVPEDAAVAVAAAHVPWRDRVYVFAARHWVFAVVLTPAALLRACAMVAYRPVEWFNDSYSYVTAAVTLVPETIRPSGYALFLVLFEPLHRFAAVTLAQHLLGLAIGAAVYGVCCAPAGWRRGWRCSRPCPCSSTPTRFSSRIS
jgi:hypothetical protein